MSTKEITKKFLDIILILLLMLLASYLGHNLGYNKATATEQTKMIKHLASPFHLDHTWKRAGFNNFKVVPEHHTCTEPKDKEESYAAVDTTEN